MTNAADTPVPVPQPALPMPMSPESERQWGLFLHLSAFSGYLGVPFGSILGPLIMWLIKKDQSPFIDEAGKEALNFHLSMLLYVIISIPLIFVLIGIVTLLVLPLLEIVLTIVAAVKTNEGLIYRFPLTIRFVD